MRTNTTFKKKKTKNQKTHIPECPYLTQNGNYLELSNRID
ncbi:unnamed protein product [Gulo gulo]|uniref:Uncharacterized protein n=1 Tax=Gulo gulo TaxID=48420 RepID=A0A9X9M1T0_GULGU|nr:unnamed protein product [Gulo gulo]